MTETPDNKSRGTQPWTAYIDETMTTATPERKESAKRVFDTFAKWIVKEPAADDSKSRMLDSTEMESRFAVDKLSKGPDGTTVVRYYFSDNTSEANTFCGNDPLAHSSCSPFENSNGRKLAREAMRDIVAESKAKIEFKEVHSANAADITFVAASGMKADIDGTRTAGFAGRGNNQNFIISAMDTTQFKIMFEQAFSQLPPDQRESVSKGIRKTYADKYGKDVSIFEILASERLRKSYAHEIEHILGAKHPQDEGEFKVTAKSDPETFNQSIMGTGESVVAGFDRGALGKTLGQLDVEWYQRHFGIKELPDSTLPAPLQVPTDQVILKKERY